MTWKKYSETFAKIISLCNRVYSDYYHVHVRAHTKRVQCAMQCHAEINLLIKQLSYNDKQQYIYNI